LRVRAPAVGIFLEFTQDSPGKKRSVHHHGVFIDADHKATTDRVVGG
jgi:hypothetical protein